MIKSAPNEKDYYAISINYGLEAHNEEEEEEEEEQRLYSGCKTKKLTELFIKCQQQRNATNPKQY